MNDFDGPNAQMLHTRFHGHWPFAPGEEDFQRFIPYMGVAVIIVM